MRHKTVEAQRVAGWVPRSVGDLTVDRGWRAYTASVHPFGEACDPVGVLAFFAELVAGEVPVGAVTGADGLDVGRLLACLPAASQHDGAVYGRALLAVDVLGVGEPQRLGISACELQSAV